MAKVYATTAQKIKINDLLRAHLKPAGESGLFEYEGDWSDKLVADMAATDANPVNAGHVTKIRLALHGQLVERIPAAGDARLVAFEAALATERARGDRLERRLADLADLHAKLCRSLQVNRVLDVSHLAGPAPERPNGAAVAAGNTRMLPGIEGARQ